MSPEEGILEPVAFQLDCLEEMGMERRQRQISEGLGCQAEELELCPVAVESQRRLSEFSPHHRMSTWGCCEQLL